MRDLLTTAHRLHPEPDRSEQIRGILHATSVCDRHLTVEIHPDIGDPPITVVFRLDQIETARAALCQRVTICGIMRCRALDVSFVDLDHIERSRTATPDSAATGSSSPGGDGVAAKSTAAGDHHAGS